MGKYDIDEFAKLFSTEHQREYEFKRLVLNELAETNRLKRISLILKCLEIQHLTGKAVNFQAIMDEAPEEDVFDCSISDLAAD